MDPLTAARQAACVALTPPLDDRFTPLNKEPTL